MKKEKSLSFDRENHQLLFATKYYFNLCENLINKFDNSESYLDLNLKDFNDTKLLYQIHLASCCFRLSAIIEKDSNYKRAYSYLNEKDKDQYIDKYLPFLIRDTVSHKEQPDHPKFDARRRELENIKIQRVHEIIKEAIVSRSR
ncbi:MAG: hypothetical protein C4522_13395 [Desulfobacteraceae bacterium]|nr:MAG: hypothetical protein C4522_13395 [Desulfobacteraceae bacterium]